MEIKIPSEKRKPENSIWKQKIRALWKGESETNGIRDGFWALDYKDKNNNLEPHSDLGWASQLPDSGIQYCSAISFHSMPRQLPV